MIPKFAEDVGGGVWVSIIFIGGSGYSSSVGVSNSGHLRSLHGPGSNKNGSKIVLGVK
ncbi:hypothetical protein KI387_016105, partial [Taxus chinensis]